MRLREGPGENPASLVSRHASHHPWLGSVAGLLEREWPVFRVLSAYVGIEPRPHPEGQPVRLADAMGATLGISCTAVAVARRPPRYARHSAAGTYDVGLRLMDEQRVG